MYFDELDELTNVLETIVFEDDPSIFTEEYTLDLMETALHLMEEFMSNNPCIITEPDFNEILLEELTCIFATQFEEFYHGDASIAAPVLDIKGYPLAAVNVAVSLSRYNRDDIVSRYVELRVYEL